MHAAILKLNKALEAKEDAPTILKLLQHPATQLRKIEEENSERYRDSLIAAKVGRRGESIQGL